MAHTNKVPTEAPVSVRINGRDLRDLGVEVINVPTLLLPSITESTVENDLYEGEMNKYLEYDVTTITLNCEVRGSNHQDLVTKLDNLKSWLEYLEFYSNQFTTLRHKPYPLKLELSGHKYYYDTGTISITNGSKIITGSSTDWLNFIVPDSYMKIEDDTTEYTVNHVNSSTEVVVDTSVARANGSGLTYKIETKRFLNVYYNGNSNIAVETSPFKHNVYQFNITFESQYPYWVGPIVEYEDTSIAAGDFITLPNIGNTKCRDLNIAAKGAAIDPQIVVCNQSFNAHFNGTTDATDIENKLHPPIDAVTTKYSPTKNELGIYFGSGEYLQYDEVPSPTTSFSFFIRFYPQFDYDALGNKYFFEYRYDGDNRVYLWYSATSDTIRLTWEGQTALTTINSSALKFVSGNEFEVAGSISTSLYDNSTYYALLYVNGILVDSETSSAPTAMSNNPNVLYVGNNSVPNVYCDSIIDELVTFVYPLTSDELLSLFFNDQYIINDNQIIEYRTNMASDDLLLIDCLDGNIEVFDASTGLFQSVNDDIYGEFPYLFGNQDHEQVVYFPNAINEVKFIYKPHWR